MIYLFPPKPSLPPNPSFRLTVVGSIMNSVTERTACVDLVRDKPLQIAELNKAIALLQAGS